MGFQVSRAVARSWSSKKRSKRRKRRKRRREIKEGSVRLWEIVFNTETYDPKSEVLVLQQSGRCDLVL